MKKLIALLFSASCSNTPAHQYSFRFSYGTYQVAHCDSAYNTPEGIKMTDCDNGKTYFNVVNIEKLK